MQRFAAHVDEFAAEEADAFRVILEDGRKVGGRGNVRCDLDAVTIDRFARKALQLLQELL